MSYGLELLLTARICEKLSQAIGHLLRFQMGLWGQESKDNLRQVLTQISFILALELEDMCTKESKQMREEKSGR